jgi:hypothetical protein
MLNCELRYMSNARRSRAHGEKWASAYRDANSGWQGHQQDVAVDSPTLGDIPGVGNIDIHGLGEYPGINVSKTRHVLVVKGVRKGMLSL